MKLKEEVTVIDCEFAEYEITVDTFEDTGDVYRCFIDVKEKGSNNFITSTFKLLDDPQDAQDFIAHVEKKLKILHLIDEFTQEMEGYSYYGSNPGISADDYEDVAERIMEKFFLK